MATVTIHDETSLGESTGELTLDFLTEWVTPREIIRSRVYQEVSEYNAKQIGLFRGLVQPRASKKTAEGFELNKQTSIDWNEQFQTALSSFAGNGFLLFVDDKQITELEVEIELRHDTRVSFLRLVPLIGG